MVKPRVIIQNNQNRSCAIGAKAAIVFSAYHFDYGSMTELYHHNNWCDAVDVCPDIR